MTTPSLSPDVIGPAIDLAERIHDTEFVPDSLKGRPEAVLAAILTGHELGVTPMQSLAGIHVIKGRPALSAQLMRALLLRDGHELWVEESTTTRCVIVGRRHGDPKPTRVTWTMDDAKTAGLAGRDNWRSYPREMLVARASSTLARIIAPDTLGGLYTVEEVEDGGFIDLDPVTGTAPEPIPPKPTRKRRGRPPKSKEDLPTVAEIRDAFDTPTPALPVPPLPGETDISPEAIDQEIDERRRHQPPLPGEDEPTEPEDALVAALVAALDNPAFVEPPGEPLQTETLPIVTSEAPTEKTPQNETSSTSDDPLVIEAWSQLAQLLSEPAVEDRTTTVDTIRTRVVRLFDLMAQVGIPRWGTGALGSALRGQHGDSTLDDLRKFDLQMFAHLTWEKAREAVAANREP